MKRCVSKTIISSFYTSIKSMVSDLIFLWFLENPVVTSSYKIEKGTAILHCSAVGKDLKTITWYDSKDKPLHHGNIVINKSPDGRKMNSTLQVPIVSCKYLWYDCAAKTDHGRYSTTWVTVDPQCKSWLRLPHGNGDYDDECTDG